MAFTPRTYRVQHSTACQRNMLACAAENIRDAVEDGYDHMLDWSVTSEFLYYRDNWQDFSTCNCDS